MSIESSKRQKYINLFMLLGKEGDIHEVEHTIKNVCLDYGCDYVIARSFLDSFYYVKIVCKQAQLDDVNNRLSSELSKHSNVISWVKTEIIEVK